VIQKVSNRERIAHDNLLEKLSALLLTYYGIIRISILKNIALVTYALLNLFSGARGSAFRQRVAICRSSPSLNPFIAGFTTFSVFLKIPGRIFFFCPCIILTLGFLLLLLSSLPYFKNQHPPFKILSYCNAFPFLSLSALPSSFI
jgi:hypothetical protein